MGRFGKASIMTDTSMTPETPNVAETAHFLRRFADMMSVGHNANYLNHAAVLLETMAVRLTAAQDEEQIWRYKYETIAQHTDLMESECEALKNDIDGHLNIISSTLSERDVLAATLQGRETELADLRDDLDRERSDFAVQSQLHEAALAGLQGAFDREREALQAAAQRPGEELEQLRLANQRERDELAAKLAARDAEISALLLHSGRERDELNARLKVSGDELAALRVVSER
jgi:chromosome segregation ATPase